MPRSSSSTLGRILEWMTHRSAPHHRDLTRGMVSELDAIADPAERRRFAIGAFATLIRLALSGYRRAAVHVLCGDSPMRCAWRWLLPGAYIALLVDATIIVLGCGHGFFYCGAWIDRVAPVLMPVPTLLGLPWTLVSVVSSFRFWIPDIIEIVVFALGIGVNTNVLYVIGAALDRRRLERTLEASTT